MFAYFSKENRAKREAVNAAARLRNAAEAKAQKIRTYVDGHSVREVIEVQREDGYLDSAFDNRMAVLLNDPTVSNVMGPRIVCTGSNPAGNYADYLYTIWYRKEE